MGMARFFQGGKGQKEPWFGRGKRRKVSASDDIPARTLDPPRTGTSQPAPPAEERRNPKRTRPDEARPYNLEGLRCLMIDVLGPAGSRGLLPKDLIDRLRARDSIDITTEKIREVMRESEGDFEVTAQGRIRLYRRRDAPEP